MSKVLFPPDVFRTEYNLKQFPDYPSTFPSDGFVPVSLDLGPSFNDTVKHFILTGRVLGSSATAAYYGFGSDPSKKDDVNSDQDLDSYEGSDYDPDYDLTTPQAHADLALDKYAKFLKNKKSAESSARVSGSSSADIPSGNPGNESSGSATAR